MWQQRISTKKCCPWTVNIACHVKQSSKTTSFGGTLSWRWCGGKSSVCVVQTATTRILRRRFPGSCETVGQVFKFVWRLRWKISAVCMSLSPFVSFQSRFVTYLLTFPRINREYPVFDTGVVCRTFERQKGCIQDFGGETWGKEPFDRRRPQWYDNITWLFKK